MEQCDRRNYADKRKSISIKNRILTKIRETADTMLTKKQKEAFYLKLMGKNSIQIGKQLRIAQMSAWERLDRAYKRIQIELLEDPEIRKLLRQLSV
jgi:DNA-binding CsgD family transcriptional regulator